MHPVQEVRAQDHLFAADLAVILVDQQRPGVYAVEAEIPLVQDFYRQSAQGEIPDGDAGESLRERLDPVRSYAAAFVMVRAVETRQVQVQPACGAAEQHGTG